MSLTMLFLKSHTASLVRSEGASLYLVCPCVASQREFHNRPDGLLFWPLLLTPRLTVPCACLSQTMSVETDTVNARRFRLSCSVAFSQNRWVLCCGPRDDSRALEAASFRADRVAGALFPAAAAHRDPLERHAQQQRPGEGARRARQQPPEDRLRLLFWRLGLRSQPGSPAAAPAVLPAGLQGDGGVVRGASMERRGLGAPPAFPASGGAPAPTSRPVALRISTLRTGSQPASQL